MQRENTYVALDGSTKDYTPKIGKTFTLGDKNKDQKRVMSPKDAFKNGATAIVMGRSILKGNIKKNIQKLVKSLN